MVSGKSSEDAMGIYMSMPSKGAKCHKFYDPAGYNDPEWRTWMTKMSKKSRLQPDEDDVLTRYLNASRRQGVQPGQTPQL